MLLDFVQEYTSQLKYFHNYIKKLAIYLEWY